MSHVSIKAPNLRVSSKKTLHLEKFDGGVSLCNFPAQLYAGQSPEMKNMIYSKNLLRTRFGQKQVESDVSLEGAFHSKSEYLFFGYCVLHIGTKLIAFDGISVRVLSEDLSDCQSFIFEMNASIYVFLRAGRVFVVDRDFNCTECELPVFHACDAKYNLGTITNYTPESDYIYLGGISVGYNSEGSYKIPYLKLPIKCDVSFPVKVLYGSTDENTLSPSEYTVTESQITFNQGIASKFTVYYTPKIGEKYSDSQKIFGCTTTVCYGGKASSGGTRVFFSGNPDYPGHYFYSELLSPLEIKPESFDIIGNGVQNINRFAKQKGDLIALCDSSIYRFTYSFDAKEGADFTVSEINPRIGCDMPGSVQLIDNRLVFANSLTGVYMIVSSDFTDELSIRSISANINGTEQHPGLLYEDRDALRDCISIDFDRKYYLFTGDRAYVWDYGNAPYVASSDPAKSERVLSWYLFDGLYENSLFEIDGALYGTAVKDGFTVPVSLSEDIFTDFGKEIVSNYRTGNSDFSSPNAKKVLCEVFFNILCFDGAVIKISVYADDKEICSEEFILSENTASEVEKLCGIFMKIPPYEAYRFSVKLESAKGILGLYDASLKFRADKIYYR